MAVTVKLPLIEGIVICTREMIFLKLQLKSHTPILKVDSTSMLVLEFVFLNRWQS